MFCYSEYVTWLPCTWKYFFRKRGFFWRTFEFLNSHFCYPIQLSTINLYSFNLHDQEQFIDSKKLVFILYWRILWLVSQTLFACRINHCRKSAEDQELLPSKVRKLVQYNVSARFQTENHLIILIYNHFNWHNINIHVIYHWDQASISTIGLVTRFWDPSYPSSSFISVYFLWTICLQHSTATNFQSSRTAEENME